VRAVDRSIIDPLYNRKKIIVFVMNFSLRFYLKQVHARFDLYTYFNFVHVLKSKCYFTFLQYKSRSTRQITN